MNSNKKTARIAGLIYLIIVLTGIFNLRYVPSKLIVWDDASATINNIMASESLFRLGIVTGLISYTCFIILPLVLYKLLKSVNKNHALLMVVLAVVSVPIAYNIMLYKVDILSLLSDAEYMKVFGADKLNAQVMLLLKSYNNGIGIVQIFWGLWLFPFGYLVFKSGFLPKFLGILLMIGCFGYLLKFFGHSLFPNFEIPFFVTLPGSIGEIGICLWLLIMGAKENGHKTADNTV